MSLVIRPTGGSVMLPAATWVALGAMGPTPTPTANPTLHSTLDPTVPVGDGDYPAYLPVGENVSGAVMLINTTVAVIYFGFSNAPWAGSRSSAPAQPTPISPSTYNVFGGIPVPGGDVAGEGGPALIIAQPTGTNWWAASATGLIVVPVEILRAA